jgi:hypothetical protein
VWVVHVRYHTCTSCVCGDLLYYKPGHANTVSLVFTTTSGVVGWQKGVRQRFVLVDNTNVEGRGGNHDFRLMVDGFTVGRHVHTVDFWMVFLF